MGIMLSTGFLDEQKRTCNTVVIWFVWWWYKEGIIAASLLARECMAAGAEVWKREQLECGSSRIKLSLLGGSLQKDHFQ
jgi:hypothetical protein